MPAVRVRRSLAAMSRKTVTGAGVITTAVLVLLFGNQAVTEWVSNHAHIDDKNRATASPGDWFLNQRTWP